MPSAHSACRGPATEPNRPGPAWPMGRIPVYVQCTHGVGCLARGALRVRAMARLEAAHRWLTDGQAVRGCRPVLQGVTWHGMV
jgi:hypothetical protein